VLIQPKDANGKVVEPFISDGTTYLPVRAVCQALGKDIIWDGDTNSVYIGKKDPAQIKEVTVSNVDELYSALGSNKHIKLKPGVYNISKLEQGYSESKNLYWEKVFDGNELVMDSIYNITLEGLGENPVEIVVEPRYADVLTFINCNNISLKNIKAGHTNKEGFCTGGVLNFDSSKDIFINDSIFYGCGTYGISANNTETLKFDNSVIEECTYGIMRITGSKDFTFTNSKFRDCKQFDMIGIHSSNNIAFDKCEITGNKALSKYWTFLNVDLSSGIKFTNCKFNNNEAIKFVNGVANIDFTGTVFEGNSFD
jgi:hypothetical protein